MVRVAVVGAGVVGLCSAAVAQQRLANAEVTIFAEQESPETTGDGSAGLWVPYILADTPPELVSRWAGRTYQLFQRLWIAGEAGATLLPLIMLYRESPDATSLLWFREVLGFHQLGERWLDRLRREHGNPYRSAFQLLTFTCEPTIFLPWLSAQLRSRGARFVRRRLASLSELMDDFDVILNCSGLGASSLVPDPSVVPVRGQVMRVAAPWLFHVTIDDSDDGSYVIPNQRSVVLGGTHQDEDWRLQVDAGDAAAIREGCRRMLRGLQHADELKHWVGLRPGRPRVRLEAETLLHQGRKVLVVHNYGHGGSGVTLCWGCAEDAVRLVEGQQQCRL